MTIWRASVLCGLLALLGAVAWPAEKDAAKGDTTGTEAPRGRWLFRYDVPAQPQKMGQPDIVGAIQAVEEGDTRSPSLCLTILDLDGGTHRVYVMEQTQIDGQAASRGKEWLKQDVPVAVFGREELGRFYAASVFTITPQDWEQVKADRAVGAGTWSLEGPPEGTVGQWPAETPVPETESGWPEAPWQPKNAVPPAEGAPASPAESQPPAAPEAPRAEQAPAPAVTAPPAAPSPSNQITAQVYSQRGDFVGKIVSTRNHGRELSVRTPRNVMLVQLDDATAISRDDETLKPGDLGAGDIIDVAASTWLGAQNCIAKQIWVVEVK
jgi:hypothetical protein